MDLLEVPAAFYILMLNDWHERSVGVTNHLPLRAMRAAREEE